MLLLMVEAGIKMASELPGMTFRLLRGSPLAMTKEKHVNFWTASDIKPYIPGYDSAANTKVPPWITSR